MSANLASQQHRRIVERKMAAARTWLPRGLGTFVFLWYALAAAPGFYWLDSAELSAGAVGLGSPHATGFPLYMLLAKLASLVPLGELAFRVNLLSAVCAGFAVAGVVTLVFRLGKEDLATLIGAVAGGMTLAVSLLFARQGTIAEVYAPTVALIVLTLLLFEQVANGAPASVGLSLAWVAGLGFGVHGSYRMLLGLPILVLFTHRLYRGARWPLLAPLASTCAAAGLYLYLPVRSATGRIPSLDWGHTDTLGRTWDHANASTIREAFADRMMSGQSEVVWEDFKTLAAQIGEHIGLLAVLAAFAGIALLLRERRTRWVGASLLAMAGIDTLYGAWINPMGLVDFQNGLPIVTIACVCAGVAVATLARLTGPAAPYVASVALVALVVPPAIVSLPSVTAVGDLPRALSEHALGEATPGSVLMTQSDSISAGALYLMTVEGARPDVALAFVPMLADGERVASELNRSGGSEFASPASSGEALATIASSGRRIFWETGSLPPPGGASLRSGALVSELVKGKVETVPPLRNLKRLYLLFDDEGRHDRMARRTLAIALTNMGRTAFAQGDLKTARDIFDAAIELRPEHAAARVNVGVILSNTGDLKGAAEATERALDYEPNRHGALMNAARYRLALGEVEAAEVHAERALRLSPSNANAWAMGGLVDIKLERPLRARKRLERALELNPRHREARAALQSLGP